MNNVQDVKYWGNYLERMLWEDLFGEVAFKLRLERYEKSLGENK